MQQQDYEVELAIGETIQIGDQLVTVIDIEGSEISLRVDRVDALEPALCAADVLPLK